MVRFEVLGAAILDTLVMVNGGSDRGLHLLSEKDERSKRRYIMVASRFPIPTNLGK